MKALAYLNKYLFKYKWLLILGIIFSTISNFFQVIPAVIVRYTFDFIEQTTNFYFLYSGFDIQESYYVFITRNILFFGVLILFMAILRGLFLFFVRQTLIVMSRLIEFDLKNEIYNHYQTLPLSFYRKNDTGDLMARISEDVSQVRMYLGPGIMYSINLITSTIMVVSYMFMINAKLAFYVLLPLPLLSLSIYLVSNMINKRSEEIQRSLSNLSTFVQEAFSGIRVIKAFAREDDSHKNFEKESENYRQKSIGLAKVQAFFMPLIVSLIGLSTVFTIYIGGIEVMNGTITNGNIAEFVLYVNILVWPVTSLGWVTSIVQRAAASQDRINEFLRTQTDIISEKNLSQEIKGKITFKNVTFEYPDSGIVALQNISFEAKPGETIAILGTTGSGKSTVANLICRMYDVSEGQILIDETPIQDYHLQNLRKQIGYVPQDVFLFSDSIENNIVFGLDKKAIGKERMITASKDADLYHNILDFPKQFDTVLGERGITISGGQKQRLSIARAIVREPQILILDDALSAVDTKTENAILNNLSRIMQNRTSIIISHRVSSAKLADKIIVLDEGKMIETGSNTELMALKGVYQELHDKQLQSEQ